MKVDRAEIGELVIERHVRIKSALGNITMHASGSSLGIWLTPAATVGSSGQIGLFIQNGTANLAVWAKHSKQFPFAISQNGLQVVTSAGQVKIIPLDRIADMVVKLADAIEPHVATEEADKEDETT